MAVSDLLDYSEPSSRAFLFENLLLLVVPTATICSSKGMIPLETIKRDITTLGIIAKSLVISMGTNQIGKRFYQVKVKSPDTTSIKELGRLMEPLQMQAFRKTYGKILELTIAEVSIEAIASLTQYYDQPLRCFTFGDFQLVPTIEEFEEILGCPLGGRKPYLSSGCLPSLSRIATVVKDSARGLDRIKQTRNGIAGLPQKYLEDKARGMASQGEWVPFMDVLALLIFGVVLLPNVDGLVGLAAIDAFLAYHHSKESPVVAILADLFDTFDRRCEKSSARIICCLPALCVWLVSHLFQQDTRHPCPLLSHRSCTEKRRMDWDQLLAGIGSRTISWFPRWKEGRKGVLFSCGRYPNIPLVGTRGCINYNPTLAIRQLGYPMRGAPTEESMSPFLVRDLGAQNSKTIQRIHKAWETPLRKDQELRGIRNGIIGGYHEWLKVRIRGLDWLAKLKVVSEENFEAPEEDEEELIACSRSKRSLSQRLCETETNMLAIIAKYEEELGLATAHEHRIADEYAQVYAEKEARGRLMEKNAATAAAVSSAAEADPTLLATTRHPPSNIVGRGRDTLGHDGSPHLGYNRAAYPYGLPPNYSPPILQEDAGHIASPVHEKEPPQQPDEVHKDPQDYARRDVEFYPPIPEGPAPGTLPQPNIAASPIYNSDMAPDRTQLQNMFKKEGETFKEYAQRWRDLAAQVAPPMVEREMITMMVDTLPVFYYEKLVGYMPSSFADLVFAGERIEVGLKRGKFDYVSSTNVNAKRIGATGAKRKEGDAHAVSSTPAWVKPQQTPHGTHQYAQHHPSFSAHAGNASSSTPVQPKAPTQREAPQVPTPNATRPAGNSNTTRNFPPRPLPEFTPLPMTYEDLLPSLIANHLAVVTPGKGPRTPFPEVYHGGAPGHSIEKCLALKYKVQHLMDAGWLTFQEDRPNVRTNPLANHGGGAVNAVGSDRPHRSKPLRDVATPRRFIFEALQKGGVIPHSGCKGDSCLLHSSEMHDMETCLEVEELLQRMIDQGRLEVGIKGKEEQHICMQSTEGSGVAKPKPLVIYFTKNAALQKPGHPLMAKPVPFPYQNSHAVPWRYTPPGKKEEEVTDVSSLSAKVTNITGLSGVTRSGRVPHRSKPLRDVATPRRFIFEALQKGGVIPHSGCKGDSCLLHSGEMHDMETCLEVEELLQRMIDQGRLEVGIKGKEEQHICMQSTEGSSVAKPKPLVIYFTKNAASQKPGHPLMAKPVPFLYQNSHAVPWRYTPPGKKEEEVTDVSSLSAKVTNITGLSGVTRSGRVPHRSKPLRDVATPRRFIFEALQKGGVIPHSGCKGDSCLLHSGEMHDMETCLEVEELLQRMIDQGRLEVGIKGKEEQHICMQSTEGSSVAKPKPLVIYFTKNAASQKPGHPLMAKPVPFPYQNSHAVPWRYTPPGKKEEEVTDVSSLSAKVTNITGLSGVTRSGPVMMARVMLGNGYEPGMGLGKDNGGITSLIKTQGNRGKYGLGYKPTQADMKRGIAGRKNSGQSSRWRQESEGSPPCHISRSFISAGLGDEGQVFAICEDDVPSTSDLVRPCPPDFQLGNWRVEERPGIYATSIIFDDESPEGMAPRKLASKRSRKDKAAEGTSSAPEYDSHRFRSVVHQQRFEAIKGWSFLRERRVQLRDDEYTDFQEEIGRRRWAPLVTPMAKFDPEIVLEFYANAWPTEEGVRDMRSWVRGQWIPFDADAISQLLGYPMVLEEGQECEYGQRRNRSDGFDEEAIAQLLSTSCPPIIIPTSPCLSMAPTRHPLDPDKSNRALGFPALITGLCQSFGVPVAPTKVIRPPITRAFIEKYCTQRQAQGDAPQAAGAPPPPHQAGQAGAFDMEQYLRHLVRQQAANHRAHVRTHDCLYQMSLSMQSQGFAPFSCPTPDQFRAEVAWPGDWPEAQAGEAPPEAPGDGEEAHEDEEMADLLDFLGGSGDTKENTETFSSLTSYPELRRSEFLIGEYVGARASLLSTTPPFVAMTQELVARGDTLWLFAPFCHPEAAGPMTSRDQVWSFCTHDTRRYLMVIRTLLSSRGGGPDDKQRPKAAGPMTSRDQVWSFCTHDTRRYLMVIRTLLSSRGGGPDDKQRPKAAGPMTSRDQVWSFCTHDTRRYLMVIRTLLSSRGGGPDDKQRPKAAGPMTSRDQVWSFCTHDTRRYLMVIRTLLSSRGGGPDDKQRPKAAGPMTSRDQVWSFCTHDTRRYLMESRKGFNRSSTFFIRSSSFFDLQRVATISPTKISQPPFLRGYNPNVTCAYHGRVLGHSIEHCMTLKHKVQSLIDAGWLKFEEENRSF
ncbi:hypothetical protein HKD37_04G010522 [Glycine soja]